MNSDTCNICRSHYEWTKRNAGLCSRCRSTHTYARGVVRPRAYEQDPLPKVDGLMELQFNNFFSLIRTRYHGLKDVSKVVNMNGHKRRKQA